ncbi:hypothetical protein [Actinomadura macra]|uniref:hypothetical protein n=1 Tax=Actinomadura macra TaxID=46164 RepID=UPI000833AD55|nr:hypothetical protein [Actinomadura macra]
MSRHEAALCALREGFPGWLIEVRDAPGVVWQAGRPLAPGRGGIVGMHADGPEVMRELLEVVEHCDHRLALEALAAGLGERGVAVRTFVTNLIVPRPDGRELLITCKRGTFRWAMGQDIGPIADLDAAVGHVVDAVKGCPP